MEIAPIACGPVSADKRFNEKLRGIHRKVSAIETESGGVFSELGRKVPAIAIRGISDLADDKKASLEATTSGSARRVAMHNACELLELQLRHARFLDVARRARAQKTEQQGEFFGPGVPARSIVATLDALICQRLRELSVDFKNRPEGFYLPLPRLRKVLYPDDIGGRELDDPQNLIDILKSQDRIFLHLPRTFPTQSLGWALAYSLIRQQLPDPILLPIHVEGSAVRPPKAGLAHAVPGDIRGEAFGPEYTQVFVIEGVDFSSKTRIAFLTEEIQKCGGKVLVISRDEESVAKVDAFIGENSFEEFVVSTISFSETEFFLEKTFEMPSHEAEIVAMRLDDTFRRFRLDAHPTYFAGLSEDTLAALINANKRAELIQLAVDGLLSLIVAADRANINLSRTTRERFLKTLVVEQVKKGFIEEPELYQIAHKFLAEYKFNVTAMEFIGPLLTGGIIHFVGGHMRFSHPYLESYLLAQALRQDRTFALSYFSAAKQFNYYAFDLYAEMGPDPEVIERIILFADEALERAGASYPDEHVFLSKEKLAALSSAKQLLSFREGLDAQSKRLTDGKTRRRGQI